jgi:hypothetical protein
MNLSYKLAGKNHGSRFINGFVISWRRNNHCTINHRRPLTSSPYFIGQLEGL